ncbi:MAG: hypothetical protein AAGB12_11020 [Pseudomonadota bacterium]
MKKILVSDIFGTTKSLKEMASYYTGDVEIVSPYQDTCMDFANEAEAYDYFITNVGLEEYAEQLRKCILSTTDEVQLVGFSIGASAIWFLSDHLDMKNVIQARCFYGSQIRHYKHIQPIFPIELIFPKYEKHFSVSELASDLSNLNSVKITHTDYRHGFMNPCAKHYDQDAWEHFREQLFQ